MAIKYQPNRIRALREAMNWPQELLGKRVGCSTSTIGMIENGERRMLDNMAVDMANVFNISLDYLFCRSDDPTVYSPSNSEDVDINKILSHWEKTGLIKERSYVRPSNYGVLKKINKKTAIEVDKAESAVSAFIECVAEMLKQNDDVTIRGFGRIWVTDKGYVKYTPDKTMLKNINKGD